MTAKRSFITLGMIYAFYFIVFATYFIPSMYLGPYVIGIVQVLLLLVAGTTVIKYLKTFFQKMTFAGAALLAGYGLTIAGLLYLTFLYVFAMIAFS